MNQILQSIDANALIAAIVTLLVIPVIKSCGKYIGNYLQAKIDSVNKSTDNQIVKDLKADLLITIQKAVIATNQTFVDALKEKNQFTKEDWAEAFNRSKTAILESLTQSQIELLTKNVGNLDKYLETLIQSAVNENKKEKDNPIASLTETTPNPTVVINTTSAEVTQK